jgi:hypothetical protein
MTLTGVSWITTQIPNPKSQNPNSKTQIPKPNPRPNSEGWLGLSWGLGFGDLGLETRVCAAHSVTFLSQAVRTARAAGAFCSVDNTSS